MARDWPRAPLAEHANLIGMISVGEAKLCALERGFQNEETLMKCVICKTGETRPGVVTVTLARGETTVVVKGTPVEICQNCGEYYFDETAAAKAQEAAERLAEVEILRYAA